MPRGSVIICCFLALLLLAIVGTASAKLFTTPLYSRIQPGMTREAVSALLYDDCRIRGSFSGTESLWSCTEGDIQIEFDGDRVTGKSIARRGPLDRLVWWFGD